MELNWKSYGDTGRTAKGSCGTWRVTTDGMWWHLSFRPEPEFGAPHWWRRGQFLDRLPAMCNAQDYEDANPLPATT